MDNVDEVVEMPANIEHIKSPTNRRSNRKKNTGDTHVFQKLLGFQPE
jgi:hypothetical protein